LTTTTRVAVAVAATACVAATTAHGLGFSETFDDGTLNGWTASADAKYEGAGGRRFDTLRLDCD